MQGKLLADQRQHRRVSQVEKQGAGGEDHQRAAGYQRLQARRPVPILVLDASARRRPRIVKSTCEVMIDGARRDREHADEARDRIGGQQIENRGWTQPISGDAGNSGGECIAGVIERFVAADTPCESLVSDKAQGDCGEPRSEDGGSRMGGRLRDRDRKEIRHPRQQQRCDGDHECSDPDDNTLGAHRVDESPRRRLG